MLKRILLLATAVVVASGAPGIAQQAAPAEPQFDVRAHYTKFEYYIPTRDGKRLFTAVYTPKEASQKYPFLMTRTPYSVAPYGVDQYRKQLGPSPDFDQAGYIFVFQDVRGRYLSEGEFVEMRPHVDHPKGNSDVDESTDTYDAVEWLLKNVANNNGRAGIWGISYPGFFTSASIIDSHPAIKAASPEAPMTDLFMGDDAYHGGAFMLAANFGFYTGFRPRPQPGLPPKERAAFDYGTTDGYEYFLQMGPLANLDREVFKGQSALWADQVAHNTYDAYWQARDLSRHMHGIKCAVLTVGGWFDAEDLSGPFKTYRSIEEKNPGIFNALVVGPWVHGGWSRYKGERLGRVEFGSDTGEFYRKHIVFPFFEQFLKSAADAKLPEAYVFETGTNVWRQYSAWPPANAQERTLYFHANHALSFEAPQEAESAFDEYVNDPAHPVPFVAYAATAVPQEYMVSDQRFAAKRADVLTYETDPLTEDVTVVGPVSPRLRVATSASDSDFDVKLIDVYPPDYPEPEAEHPTAQRTDVLFPTEAMGGYEQLVRGEPFRGKFRASWEHPQPFTPNQMAEIKFDMPDVNHTFRRGHRIMVQVQSS